jgi:histidinol-phosphatase (PHP family)
MYLYDYHTHSAHSTDGKDEIKDLCVSAVSKGLMEIAISDHFEPTKGNESYPVYKAEKYFEDINKARELCSGKIKIITAVELGQPHHFPEHSLDLINTHKYDYVLASAHKMENDTDFSELVYHEENMDYNCLKYLAELQLLAQWNNFDCIGHLDLVKRYAANYSTRACLMNYREYLEDVLTTIIRNGKGIEINTSGLRQASKACMPDLDIASLYHQLGGEIITVGSDAHAAEDVGKGIGDAIELIKNAGFKYLTVFSGREPQMVRISDKTSVYMIKKQTA